MDLYANSHGESGYLLTALGHIKTQIKHEPEQSDKDKLFFWKKDQDLDLQQANFEQATKEALTYKITKEFVSSENRYSQLI